MEEHEEELQQLMQESQKRSSEIVEPEKKIERPLTAKDTVEISSPEKIIRPKSPEILRPRTAPPVQRNSQKLPPKKMSVEGLFKKWQEQKALVGLSEQPNSLIEKAAGEAVINKARKR